MRSLIQTPLVDTFGRVHTSLRVSVTDRCNIRCFYCMPLENIRFKPRDELLTFEEIARVVRVASLRGVRKLRLTGGEPLVRSNLPDLIRQLREISGIEEVALTTNGMLLADQAAALKQAGLSRVNISLDSLNEATFEKITRRTGVDRVLAGIAAAQEAGFEEIRLNTVAIRNLTEEEIVPLANFARENDLHLRFIEFMPLDADKAWHTDQVLSGQEMREIISREVAPLVETNRPDKSQPATDYAYADGKQRIGFISSVTQPFCGACNRLRMTAEGQFRNCLFGTTEWDARQILRNGGSDDDLAKLLGDCVTAKKASHGMDSPEFVPPERAMYQIGG
ncbi:GTP 3',8-cyclase MoaA [Blastopirellula marina]|uniref:GTP 3',8-cyclase n=1 Tax=Blastopirellula marina TaxID=124 RepID=A0A2S8G101_9BACT|nr:GTP 3',8-cyclase MoaA [Blastopirellula marina]PQO38119.1 GTP 3',8-cyclase MoaA [Blastopirellula marina]PTL44775.1 GTP 3',8-cyclase MoaA [Blastopirellula marina]